MADCGSASRASTSGPSTSTLYRPFTPGERMPQYCDGRNGGVPWRVMGWGVGAQSLEFGRPTETRCCSRKDDGPVTGESAWHLVAMPSALPARGARRTNYRGQGCNRQPTTPPKIGPLSSMTHAQRPAKHDAQGHTTQSSKGRKYRVPTDALRPTRARATPIDRHWLSGEPRRRSSCGMTCPQRMLPNMGTTSEDHPDATAEAGRLP